jgi:hypothetical protein
MTNTKVRPLRSDETGKHVRSDSPVDRPAQNLDIEEFDRKRSKSGATNESDERHEKRPEGPFKDPADEKKQGEIK